MTVLAPSQNRDNDTLKELLKMNAERPIKMQIFSSKTLEVREASLKTSPHKVSLLGLWVSEEDRGEDLAQLASALEGGR